MEDNKRPGWDALPEAIKAEWIREATNFYAPGTVNDSDIVAMAQENYTQAETLHPDEDEQEAA
jgi:hypothetical protein